MEPRTRCTDFFREEHATVKRRLDAIEAELEAARVAESPRALAIGFRRLIILMERDIERHLDDEERLLYAALLERDARGLDVTLHECFEDHGAIRLAVEDLRFMMSRAVPWNIRTAINVPAAAACASGLIREHMEREESLLFPHADSMLPPTVLAVPVAPGHRLRDGRGVGLGTDRAAGC